MAIITDRVTLATEPTLIVADDNMSQEVHLHNMSKAALQYVHIGNEDVSATNSIHIDPGNTLTLTLLPGDPLYAMSDPSGVNLGIIVMKKAD